MRTFLTFVALATLAIGLHDDCAFAAEGARIYVYKDYNSPENKALSATVMPARAAEVDMIRLRTFDKPGIDGKGTGIKMHFNVDPPPTWAGVVLPVQQDYWGDWEAEGLDLSRATKLVFYARGDIGGEQIQVKAAIAGDKPYGDSALFPVSTTWITLGKEWNRYEVPVDGAQLSRVITPFAVIVNKPTNPSGRGTIYLDEIYYELSE